jgi:hypothetical protein
VYLVDVTIGRPEGTVATFHETRLGDATGKPYYFSTQGEALMAGDSAVWRDDLDERRATNKMRMSRRG